MDDEHEETLLRSAALQNAESIRLARRRAELQTEATLREQASLLDLTHDTVFVRDMRDTVTYWNRAAAELYGWTREEALGRVSHRLMQTVFPAPLAEINAELLRSGRWEGELVHSKRDGTKVSVASRWVLQRDEHGKAVAVLETNNDITERKRSEADLLHKTALLGELFEGGPDAMVLSSLEERVLRVNREFSALFGYSAEEALGRHLAELIVPADELERSLAARALAHSTPRRVAFDGVRRRKDGSRIQVSIKGGPIVLGGQASGYYAIYRDITQRKRAEEALRLSEERYALAMLAAEDAHWDWIVGSDNYYLSPRTLQLFGLPPDTVFTSREDYLARTPIVREDLEKWQRAMGELFAGTGSRLSMEVRAIVHGEVRWMQHIGVCVRDASGRPARWCGTARDVTERRRTEEALRRSETYLAEAQKLSRTGSWAWNAKTKQVSHWSEEQYRMLGFDPQAAVPSDETILSRIHPADHARYIDDLKTAVRERRAFETHYRVCLPEGTARFIDVVGHPVFNADGDLVEYVGSSMDVTERKRAEEALREREGRIRRLVESNIIGVFFWNLGGGITDANDAFLQTVGYSRQDLLSGKLRWSSMTAPEYRAADEKAIEELMRSGPHPSYEKEYIRSDGTRVTVLLAGAMFEGSRDQGVSFVLDLTEHKKASEALRDAQGALARVNRVTTLGVLAASIAHEVNQPLGAIVTSAASCSRWLTAEPPELARAQRALERIAKDGRRAAEVIDRIRTLVKRQPPRRDRIDLNEAILEVIALTRDEMRRNDISLETSLAPDLPRVAGDGVQLQQVILNLIVNAIESLSALQERRRELVIRSARDGGNAVRLEVRDSGAGIDGAQAEQIFEAFYTTKAAGIGMGLSISRSIIESHGGRLWVTPNTPHGAAFQFCLPLETAVA